MRVLFSGTPAVGHLVPQIPLARALRDQGHAVAFTSARSMAGLLAGERFELLEAGPEIPDIVAEVQRTTGADLMADGVTVETEAEFFAGARVDLGFRDCLGVARDWRPDLIVAEEYDFIAPMVGAALGVPAATLTYGPAIRPESVEALRVRAEARYRKFGVQEAGPTQWYLDTCPPSLQFDDWKAPETRIALRPEAYSGGVAVPDAGRQARERPLVLVSFGTIFVIPEVISPVVNELLKRDVDIRVTLGSLRKAEEFDIDSPRVEFVGFTPLEQLLGDVDVVLTAGGAGTVIGTLAHGIPMVLTPMGADQPIHAARAAAAGAGIAFKIGESAPAAVADAVATVLGDASFRQAARHVAAEIATMPSPAEVGEILRQTVGSDAGR
jgi:UDP:flavonoid glycosyltransferase YjiC (YdhE family)